MYQAFNRKVLYLITTLNVLQTTQQFLVQAFRRRSNHALSRAL